MARRYVLDTHACVLLLAAPARLGKEARAAVKRVEAGRDEAWIPAAVIAEILLLRGLGRTEIGLPELRTAMRETPGFRFLPLDLEQLDEFAGLASIREPFDRLIASAARSLGASLITRDGYLAASGLVEAIWS
jgi:PIN domain nuclease of toxin-antitoxin system